VPTHSHQQIATVTAEQTLARIETSFERCCQMNVDAAELRQRAATARQLINDSRQLLAAADELLQGSLCPRR
jgi:hypothetical protein